MREPDPPWLRFVNRNRLRGAIPRGVGATLPRFGADAARVATPEERARAEAAPSVLERILQSAQNVGRQVAENPLRTAADLTPGVGDALALKDAVGYLKEGSPWMAGLAAASVIPGVPSVVRGAKRGGDALAAALPPAGSPQRYVSRVEAAAKGGLTPEESAVRAVAEGLKDGRFVDEAAAAMLPQVPHHARLVPLPSSSGSTAPNRALAEALARQRGGQVFDVLDRAAPAPSSTSRRRAGLPGNTLEEQAASIRMRPDAALPEGGTFYLVDNVETTGATAEAGRMALGRPAGVLPFARASVPAGETAVDRVRGVPSPALAAALAREGGALAVTHNTRATNLPEMARMGGIPVPSLAILRNETLFPQYGDVSLIGTREMADPRSAVVFDGDSYSPRQPKPEFEPLHRPLRDRLIRDYRAMSDDPVWQSNVWDALHSKNPDPAAFGSAAVTSTGGSEAFLRSREIPVVSGSSQQELDELIAAVTGVRPDEAREVVRAWAKEEMVPWIGSPVVKVGNRSLPYTLDNVTDAMTRPGKVLNQESGGLTYGPGRLAASQLKRLKTPAALDKAAAARLRDGFATGDGKALADKAWDRVVESVVPSYRYSSTWDALDDVNIALSKITKANPTDGEIRAALSGRDFVDVTPEGVAAAREYLTAVRSVPQTYFEAKPMRAVRLEEFPGAVVPQDVLGMAQDALGPSGVEVRGYKGNKGDYSPDRQAAIVALRRELAEKGHSTLFQLGAVGAAGLLAKYGLTMDDPIVDDL